ncbi:type VII secretion AAA-ATPase EccA, partial [Mycobacterium kansasii]
PTARIAITTDELINARTNMWDPSTTPMLATTITEDRRAVLLKEANDELAELIGLDSVKDSIEDLQANVRISGKLREK